MDETDDLEQIANQMEDILKRFKRTREGIWIADGDQAKFTGLVLEAREILNTYLGPLNDFGFQLHTVSNQGVQNYTGSQSYHSVEVAIGIVRSAAIAVRRKRARPLGVSAGSAVRPYVSLGRIEQLRRLRSPRWDFRRLVRMCEELNGVFAAGNFLASAMLLRAIIDHVPPIFGVGNFGQFASSVAGRSIKASMEQLNRSSRNIADTWLHQQIRRSENLPTETQVDYRQDLDVLLGEVVRAAEESARGDV